MPWDTYSLIIKDIGIWRVKGSFHITYHRQNYIKHICIAFIIVAFLSSYFHSASIYSQFYGLLYRFGGPCLKPWFMLEIKMKWRVKNPIIPSVHSRIEYRVLY